MTPARRLDPDAWHVAASVRDALADRRPVVALESAVVTHGLPGPHNLAAARAMADAVRDAGATPAMVAVLDGVLRVGLGDAELERVAAARGPMKCGPRELAAALATGGVGGTTVAATAWAARRCGIAVMATGGIGGVHRGRPFDVSADLPLLGRTPITLVSSGAKSLLDLAATLEVLETHGVLVAGYGVDRCPAFTVADGGQPLERRVDSAAEAAALARARDRGGWGGAILVAVPPPAGHALEAADVEAWVERAHADADAAGIAGAALTPWVLDRMAMLSDGRTLWANLALLENNARVAAEIAVELAVVAPAADGGRLEVG